MEPKIDSKILECFAPAINAETKILVIGTMPGVASLKAAEYYAHPRNAFWKIISRLFNNGKEFQNYQEKISCILAHGIGLWDNLQNCIREGSLDSNIKNAVPNDFETLLAHHHINKLLFNGQKSFEFFKRYHGKLLETTAFETMPSTSPANATISFEKKMAIWQKALIIQNIN